MPNRVQCDGSGNITLQEIVTAINLIEDERGGIYWEAAIAYEKGDIIVEDDTAIEAWICTVDHTSAVGDNVNGSPKESLSIVWDYIIPDPGLFP